MCFEKLKFTVLNLNIGTPLVTAQGPKHLVPQKARPGGTTAAMGKAVELPPQNGPPCALSLEAEWHVRSWTGSIWRNILEHSPAVSTASTGTLPPPYNVQVSPPAPPTVSAAGLRIRKAPAAMERLAVECPPSGDAEPMSDIHIFPPAPTMGNTAVGGPNFISVLQLWQQPLEGSVIPD